MSAIDVWGEVSVSERLTGEIGLYQIGEMKTNNSLQLPLGKLGRLRTFAASPDLRWLALSSRTRGGVWDLNTGERIFYFRGFQNAHYTPNSVFFLDFPEFEKSSREIVVLSPLTRQSKERMIEKEDDVTFFGDIFLRTKHNDKNRNARRNFELDALDMASAKPLWLRNFPKQGPWIAGSPSSGKLILVWNAKSDGLRDELARDPRLQDRWDKEKPGDTDYFLEVLNTRDGTAAGGIVVRTGKYSFRPEQEDATGDSLVVADNHNRVLVYSISTGAQKAKWFGYRPQISGDGSKLCLGNGRGRLVVYDLHTLKEINEFSFTSRVSGALFSADGNRLFVLTNDQTGFLLDVSAASGTTASSNQ
jgi:WD40 repeat protein